MICRGDARLIQHLAPDATDQKSMAMPFFSQSP